MTTDDYLCNSNGRSQARLNLAQVNNTSYADQLQHTVPVIRLREMVILFDAPWICTAAPANAKKFRKFSIGFSFSRAEYG